LWMRLQTPDKPARLEGATKGVNGWIVLALITKTADSASRRIQRWPSNPLVNTASGVTQGRGPLGLSIAIRHTSSTCLCWRPGLRKPVSRATMHSQTPSNVLSNASTLASPMDALRFVFTTDGHRSGEQQRQNVGSSSHFINYIDPTTHYATVDPGPIYSLADDTELVRRTAVS